MSLTGRGLYPEYKREYKREYIKEHREEEVFFRLREILEDLMGEDEAEILGIRRESGVVRDLMIDSIQIAVFAERLNLLYGDQVNFSRWFSKKTTRQLMDITLGEISAFIAGETDGEPSKNTKIQ